MKTTSIKLFLIAIAAIMTFSVSAQDGTKQRKSREELAKTQAQQISNRLAFDSKTSASFIDTYCQYQREVWALGPRLKDKKGVAAQKNGNTDNTTTVKERLDRSQKLLDIRKKYYDEYSKFLTEEQIERVYQLERQMMNRLAHRGGKKAKRR